MPTTTEPRRPGATARAVRVVDELWIPARYISKHRREDLSGTVIRPALEAYVAEHLVRGRCDADDCKARKIVPGTDYCPTHLTPYGQ